MRNLLDIETGLLDSEEVKNGLQLTKIRSLQRSINTARRTKFRKQLDLARVMKSSKDWFDLETTQELFLNAGVTWSADELADKVFECQKSWLYKCIKASNIDENVVEMFEYQCKHLQDNGQRVKMGIEPLNQFAKAYSENENAQVSDLQNLTEQQETENVVGDTTEAETGEESTESRDTIFTMTFQLNAHENVSVRYDINDGLVTTNSVSQIQEAINFLTEHLLTPVEVQ